MVGVLVTLHPSPDRLLASIQLSFYFLTNGDRPGFVQRLTNGRFLKARRSQVIANQFHIIDRQPRLCLCKEFLALPAVFAVSPRLLSFPCDRKHARGVPPECEVVFGVLQLLLLLW